MNREEYIEKQQELRRKQNDEKRRYRDVMDALADEHARNQRSEMEAYRDARKKAENEHQDIAAELHLEAERLHSDWIADHPYTEVVIREDKI